MFQMCGSVLYKRVTIGDNFTPYYVILEYCFVGYAND